MENNNDNRTLDEMKMQFGLLNEKLKNQEIINDAYIRQSIRNKVSDINRNAVVAVFGGVFAVFGGSAFFLTLGLPESFVVATDILVVGCIIATMYIHRGLWRYGLFASDLVEASRKIRNLRKNYSRWTMIGMIAAFLWLAWLIYLCLSIGGDQSFSLAMGGTLGGFIGLGIGIRKNREVIRKADEILKDLREIGNLRKGE